MAEMSILAFVEELERAMFNLAHEEHKAMEEACVLIETQAKSEISNYQAAAGPFPAWPALSDATLQGFWHAGAGFWVMGKEQSGYAPPDNPLLRDGTLRDSIEHRVEGHFGTTEGAVGSNDPVAVYQEMGTPGATYPIPPRSFLGSAAFIRAHHVAHILGQAPLIALCGQHVASRVIPIP